MAPAIAVLQRKGEQNAKYSKERALSLYMFTGTLIGSLGPFLIGLVDDGKSYQSIRMALFLGLGISYIGSALLFYLLGQNMKEL